MAGVQVGFNVTFVEYLSIANATLTVLSLQYKG
jgi:hypothetical protein